jgi:glycosyltransferase involved in cell wall biosynthesis
VPPEDPEIIEQAIRRAITDDNLVNGAAEINYQIAKEKLDKKLIKPKIVELYKSVFRTISNN